MTETTLPFDGKNADHGIAVDDRGELAYSTASESGHVEVVLPSLPGSPNSEERLLAKDFGPHVASRIEASIHHLA